MSDRWLAESRRWLALVVISTGQLLVVLSDSVVNVALPSVARDLHLSVSSRSWAITAYVVAFGGLLLVAGRIADGVGRKRSFVVGLFGFATASIVGGVASTAGVFFAARAGQGAFAALVTPAALSLITVTFTDPRERVQAFGVYGAVSGAGAALGVVVGGLLTEYASWRWTLLVNVPIASAAAAAAMLFVRESRPGRPSAYDVSGASMVTLGLTGLVWGLTQAGDSSLGWTDWSTVPLIGVSVVLLMAFVAHERRSTSPLIPLRILRDRMRGAALLSAVLINASLFGVFLLLAFYFQDHLGMSALQSGLAFLPFSGAIVISAALITGIANRVGPRRALLIGMLICFTGLVLLSLLRADSTYLYSVIPAEILIGSGLGFVFVGQPTLVLHRIPDEDTATASALLNTAQQVGGAIGTALLTTVFASTALSGGAPDGISAYRHAFAASAALILIAFAVVIVLAPPRRHTAAPGVLA